MGKCHLPFGLNQTGKKLNSKSQSAPSAAQRYVSGLVRGGRGHAGDSLPRLKISLLFPSRCESQQEEATGRQGGRGGRERRERREEREEGGEEGEEGGERGGERDEKVGEHNRLSSTASLPLFVCVLSLSQLSTIFTSLLLLPI